MNELTIYRRMIEGASRSLREAVEGVSPENAGTRPVDGANPVSFIYFHVLRHWDRDFNIFCNRQSPDSDAWHRHEFGVAMDYKPLGIGEFGLGTGYGYSDAEVDDVPADMAALGRYHDVLDRETADLLENVDLAAIEDEQDVHGIVDTVGGRLRHMIAHTFLHVGDIEYAKGLVDSSPADLPTVS